MSGLSRLLEIVDPDP